MPTRASISLASLIVVSLGSLALTAAASPELFPLDPSRPDAAPVSVRIAAEHGQGLSLAFELGALQRETVDLDDRAWTALMLPDGAVVGEAGQPGLPVWSGLVVVPDGAQVIATARVEAERTLVGLDLLPVQPDDADRFVIDEAWYAEGQRTAVELVRTGTPARMAGVTVLPIQVSPVAYDAAARTATVTTRLRIDLAWSAGLATTAARPVPESMRRLLADAAINAPRARDDDPPANASGSWAIVCPAISTVRTAIQPLVDWRRRQGWNVVVADLNDTGPTAYAIKNWLEQQYQTLDPPLEHVVLVGDANGTVALPTWNETVSGFYGEGDHYYANLDGDDVLADVHVGRLSCRNVSQLEGIVAKIIGYETTPPLADPSWYTSALVVGDPYDSGITTVYCGQWLAAQLAGSGYDDILEVYSGNFASAMISGLNQGRSVFGYRGFAGMSGFTAAHASYLTNGLELPFACFPTCLTGSFKSDTVCRSEAFLANANGGAIGAIGTATGGTHTRYNNCYFQGTWEGAINGSDHQQGAAHTRGKLELYRNYQLNEPSAVEIWSVWNNLMGDPATDLWLAPPRTLQVDHPVAIPAAAQAVPVSVLAGGQPVQGARVALVQGEQRVAVARTGASGQVTLPVADLVDGPLQVTVSGHGLRPYLAAVEVSDQPHWVVVDQIALDDSAGDGDGTANPAEALQIALTLRNVGSELVTGVAGLVASESPWLTITQPAVVFGDIAAGGTASGDRTLRLAVAADAPDLEACALRLETSGDQGSWVARFEVPLVASRLEPAGVDFSAGEPLPGTSGELVVDLVNAGSRGLNGAAAVLRARSPWVAITDSLGAWGAIPVGGSGTNASDPFGVTFAGDCPRGYLAPFTLILNQDDGSERRVDLTVTVGETGVIDPAGPDSYGYYAYDDGDLGYPQAPLYEWVEIDPYRGGSGADVGLTDFGYEQDDTRTVDLPFTFRYYGVEYEQLSICSNGWVAMGETDLRHYRNWSIPSAGSPDAMIAVFWDDLRQNGSNRVYHWYDAANHRYIVQWSRMPNYHGGVQTCQVILLDPAHHITSSGDGMIVCQYHTVVNNDYTRGYATAGIQDHTRTDGVLYTYYDEYAPGAAPLVAGRAIAYLPAGVLSLATCEVSPPELAFTADPGGQQELVLHLVNGGPPGSPLVYAIDQLDPAVSSGGAKSLVGCTMVITEDGYEVGVETTLHVEVFNGSPDDEWVVLAALDFPPGATVIDASDMAAPNYTLPCNGATGDGVEVIWGTGSGTVIYVGQTGYATVTVTVAPGTGDLVIPWRLEGDNYGSPPHTLTGDIFLPGLNETIRVEAPMAGAVWSEGESRVIGWFASEDIAAVDLALSRDGGQSWQDLAGAVPAADVQFAWVVSGPVSGNCLMRVASSADPSISDTGGPFVIQHDLSWLSLDSWNGTVPAGDSAVITATADATGLATGFHEQHLVITNNGGSAVLVPVTFAVGDVTEVNALPRVVTLAQNRPNPFNPVTTIDFALPAAGPVELAVYDLAGRRVAVLVSGVQPAGRHHVVWRNTDASGRSLASGTYVYRLQTAQGVWSRSMTLVK